MKTEKNPLGRRRKNEFFLLRVPLTGEIHTQTYIHTHAASRQPRGPFPSLLWPDSPRGEPCVHGAWMQPLVDGFLPVPSLPVPVRVFLTRQSVMIPALPGSPRGAFLKLCGLKLSFFRILRMSAVRARSQHNRGVEWFQQRDSRVPRRAAGSDMQDSQGVAGGAACLGTSHETL